MAKAQNQEFIAKLKTFAEQFDIAGPGLSGQEYGLLFLAALVDEGCMDAEVMAEALATWDKMPKNASACRQALFERGDDGEKISKSDLMLKKYLKGTGALEDEGAESESDEEDASE